MRQCLLLSDGNGNIMFLLTKLSFGVIEWLGHGEYLRQSKITSVCWVLIYIYVLDVSFQILYQLCNVYWWPWVNTKKGSMICLIIKVFDMIWDVEMLVCYEYSWCCRLNYPILAQIRLARGGPSSSLLLVCRVDILELTTVNCCNIVKNKKCRNLDTVKITLKPGRDIAHISQSNQNQCWKFLMLHTGFFLSID